MLLALKSTARRKTERETPDRVACANEHRRRKVLGCRSGFPANIIDCVAGIRWARSLGFQGFSEDESASDIKTFMTHGKPLSSRQKKNSAKLSRLTEEKSGTGDIS